MREPPVSYRLWVVARRAVQIAKLKQTYDDLSREASAKGIGIRSK